MIFPNTYFDKCLSTFIFKVKVNKNNYTLTFSGHVGVGDPGLNESFTQSMSESIERHQLQNIAGTMQKNFFSYHESISLLTAL